jgi:hypothetical protein
MAVDRWWSVVWATLIGQIVPCHSNRHRTKAVLHPADDRTASDSRDNIFWLARHRLTAGHRIVFSDHSTLFGRCILRRSHIGKKSLNLSCIGRLWANVRSNNDRCLLTTTHLPILRFKGHWTMLGHTHSHWYARWPQSLSDYYLCPAGNHAIFIEKRIGCLSYTLSLDTVTDTWAEI